jgi:hypothetical protein
MADRRDRPCAQPICRHLFDEHNGGDAEGDDRHFNTV